jgi:hypothetical protein
MSRIIVNWFDVYAQKDHPDEGCDPDSGFSRGDEGPGQVFSCLEKLYTALDMICLPPLYEWEPSENEEGQFHFSKQENEQGIETTDEEFRADPKGGLFLVDYSISVSVAETRMLVPEDLKGACIILPGMSAEAADDCTMHGHEVSV